MKSVVRPVVVAGIAGAVVGASAITADAAVSFTVANLNAVVTGTSVSASATVTAATTTTVSRLKICVRDQSNTNRDFPGLTNAQILSTGTELKESATLPVGTYSYWVCIRMGDAWFSPGVQKTFTVAATNVLPPPTNTNLPVGDLPGWKQVFTEDFNTSLAKGGFPGPYAGKWMSYNGFTDTSGAGDYDQKTIAVQNGALDIHLGPVNGRPKGAAPIPLVNGKWGGQTYGRFSVRMRSDAIPGYGTGFLLWPDSNNWNDGEIDFPESGLDNTVKGYNHCVGNPSQNCLVFNTTARYTDWHIYTIDWTPTGLTYLIDGKVVGSTTSSIPTKPLHWVMQVATTGNSTAAMANSGHLQIDWAAIYTHQP